MKFRVTLTSSAEEDLRHFRAYEQRAIVDAILRHLSVDAGTASGRRRMLRSNVLAPWELRVGLYRAFYEVEGADVKVVAIGHKEHSVLLIRGRVVDL
jgi:mRNA-degrading endonuclease RelE of RelBE toxin-antitoxin system